MYMLWSKCSEREDLSCSSKHAKVKQNMGFNRPLPKSYDLRLRSQMTTERLSNLALLSIEKDVTDALRYSDVIEHFKRMKFRRFLL